MWSIFEIVAMVLFVCACSLGIYCAMTNHIKYAVFNLCLALINGAVIFVARLAQAGGL